VKLIAVPVTEALAAVTLTQISVSVLLYELFVRVKLVRVERSQSLVCTGTNTYNYPIALKNSEKIVKCLECLVKVYSTVAGNLVRVC